MRATVSKNGGCISSIVVDGKEKLSSPIMLNFWRAAIDNDKSPQIPHFALALLGKTFFKSCKDHLVKSNMTITDKSLVIDWSCSPQMLSLKTVYEAGDDGLKSQCASKTQCSRFRDSASVWDLRHPMI